MEEKRAEIEKLNMNILAMLNKRAKIVGEIRLFKDKHGIPLFCPEREQEMLEKLISKNRGPFKNETIKKLFLEIFRASLNLMETEEKSHLFVSRKFNPQSIEVNIGGSPMIIAGPCSVESKEQMEAAAKTLVNAGVSILRGGAFKPRTSPYSFQGLGIEGLKILKETADRHSLYCISEVTDTRTIETALDYLDIIQIGARNMYNYDLLKEVGRTEKPILLKRAFSATIDEFILAAEYIFKNGNDRIILCERGIRTFETRTRNTLDIAAIPILKRETRLPVIVDVSHAAGRKDILAPLASASLAAGADGIMVEMHPWPENAR